MRTLGITLDLGPGVLPSQVEALVRGVRVATDIGLATERLLVRRVASEQMKFPTDDELRAAIERLPQGDETGPRYRARRHLEARDRLAHDFEDFPPRMLDYWYRWRRGGTEHLSYLAGTGYDRAFEATPLPWQVGSSLSLDVLDPILYQALVADQVARLAPGEIVVREVRYANPFGEVVAGVGAAEKAVKTTAGVIETAATLGSRRRLKKAEAEVAERTVEDRIEDSALDVDLKREQLRRARLENALAEEDLLAKRILNVRALQSLRPGAIQQALVDHFTDLGLLDQADAIAAADASDAAALAQFAGQAPQLAEGWEPDPDEDR